MILERSAVLRLLTVFLFYFTQGVPIGLFYFAIPAWLGASGASPAEIAGVVGAASLPWSLKLINGFIMDRYTFLPMGRRRIWIIGAQGVMMAGLLIGAAISPDSSDIWLLSALAFAVNSATTFQDVAIDGLAIDIMTDDERTKASGIMFGAQTLGFSSATFFNGKLLDAYGISAAYAGSAFVIGLVLLYGVLMRERAGERRLPWSSGKAHPRNLDIQVDAWWPLLRDSFKALLAPISIYMLFVLVSRSLIAGAGESFHPVLSAETLGWQASDYTDLTSSAQLAAGVAGLVVGGWLISKIGNQRALIGLLAILVGVLVWFVSDPDSWSEPWRFRALIWTVEFTGLFIAIAMIPMAMRLCLPAVAATQFTIYMAVGNFGRPIGAAIAAATAGAGNPVTMYWVIAGIYAAIMVSLLFIKVKGIAPEAGEEAVEQTHPVTAETPNPVED